MAGWVGRSSKSRSSSGTWTRGRNGPRSSPVLVVWRSVERVMEGNEVVDDEAYGESRSCDLLGVRRWKRLGREVREVREARALVMRDGRRASPAAPPGADDPASERW